MNIIKCSDEEWDASLEMFSGNDSALSELPMDVSPRDMEMFASHFGTLEDGVLYLG